MNNGCLLNSYEVRFHVVMPIRYEPKAPNDAKAMSDEDRNRRVLQSWSCVREKRGCDGITLDLTDAEAGKPLEPWHLIADHGYLDEPVGNVFTIKIGAFRTFTVDLAVGQVRYAQSGEGLEGRGEATCKVKLVEN